MTQTPPSQPWPWIIATASALVAFIVIGILYWQARLATEQAERASRRVTASNETLTKAIEKWRTTGEASADRRGRRVPADGACDSIGEQD